jgi:hypothetical protein
VGLEVRRAIESFLAVVGGTDNMGEASLRQLGGWLLQSDSTTDELEARISIRQSDYYLKRDDELTTVCQRTQGIHEL